LISTISAARPKIADYPFTTLVPQLGVVAPDSWTSSFVIADLPGLISGAASGAGLGTRFLRHTERCRMLIHLVDLGPLEPSSAAEDLATVEAELAAFNTDLLQRPRLVVGSKADVAQEERRQELRQAAEERGLPYHEISSATGEGVQGLVSAIRQQLSTPSPPARAWRRA
ncbi:MAG: 50S ribosome-binding GTPase, partial [Acidobacteria bacterium]|nr:50S ribosome-binding GTPase [Acidobacteriota bacterium]